MLPVLGISYEVKYGLTCQVLDWLRSFLTDRAYRVAFDGSLSSLHRLSCGVPQGSILGPILFILYTAGLSDVVAAHQLNSHSYADDTQLYVSCAPSDITASISRLAACVSDAEGWLRQNRLRLNPSKTEVICLGTRPQLSKVTAQSFILGSSVIQRSTTVRSLGFILDEQLTMSAHISNLTRACFFQLRQLSTVFMSLTPSASAALVHAFVHSRLDYCNAILFGITDKQLRRLQAVQNAAARLLTHTRRHEHISPVLTSLHWLPIRHRILFKVATLMASSLRGCAPEYLAEICLPLDSLRRPTFLRSSASGLLSVPRTNTTFGDRSFSVGGPRTWNDLPVDLRDLDQSMALFRNRLKTFYFSEVTAAHL